VSIGSKGTATASRDELVAADELNLVGNNPEIERQLLHAMVNVVPDYLFVKDRGSRFILANRAVAEDIGRTVEDLLGKTDFELHPRALAEKFFADEQAVMTSGIPHLDIEEFVIGPSGERTYLLTSKVPLRNTRGEVIGIVGVARDVTARHRAEEALAESESRWNFALEGAGQGVWDHDLRKGTAFYSRVWRQMRGIGLDEPVNPSREAWLERVHPDDRERLIEETNRQNSGSRAYNSFEYRERHRDGHYIWVLSRGKPVEWNPDGSVARIIGTDTDITKLKEDEERRAAEAAETYRRHLAALQKAHEATEAAHQLAQTMARHDALTGLPNRRVFHEALQAATARADRGVASAILIVDLDHFKPINDLYGHAAGDLVLTEVSKRLASQSRANDFIARLGGDEFGVILDCSGDDPGATAAAFAARLLAAVTAPIVLEGQTAQVGASIGIAVCPADGADADTLMRAADMAMYRAKEEGRGTFRMFQPSMERALRQRMALEDDVRRAVAEERIEPHFQPLIRLSENRLVGFEILARWRHPVRGDVPPETFIPVVEKLGLIGELTYSILRRACKAARDWPQDITLALNVSPLHFSDPLLPGKTLAILSETGFSPTRLEIEITETALVADIEAARAALATLQSLGIRISLDDFGIGYSNLYNLGELHFDKIKIDRSFVRTMQSNSGSAKIVHSVIELARSLGLPTIAEGIEHQDALRQVLRSGGEFGQGFYFGKAMPAAEAEALLRERAPARSLAKGAGS
jgi:diguanylate cyclase (GGDEF)-like protein/PAS domain S-box-containing protein